MTEKADIEQFQALLRARHSCRGFLPKAVPDQVIKDIVKTAQLVPSWCNAQPWQVIVTRGAETEAFRGVMKQAMETASLNPDIPFPQHYEGVYRDRRSACGWQLYEATGVAKGDREASARQMARNFDLFGAPHVAIITTEAKLGSYGVLDCGAFVSAFMLAAAASGVASIAQAAIAGYSDEVRAHFGIPEGRHILCGISFGFEDAAHPANGFRTVRANLDEVLDLR
ncbi:MAG: nitroreductase [Alphaproteobacteria bacterium]|nr:nitroreductase [Alphaproteobacteria bacterium]